LQTTGTPEKNEYHLSRLAAVGQIAAGIAHEVRNPLTAVKGFLQLLHEHHPHNYLEIAQTELENAITTLQDLLTVAKPDLDDEPLSKFSLCVELEALLNLFQDQMYRVAVHKDLRDAQVEVHGKRGQLKKAFFNILKNSFEAIPQEGHIHVRHFANANSICVIISDTGVGIPEEKLSMLGTPFFTTKANGTGMGLAQVFSTVYQHGGSIQVESEEGIGTTFTFHFPRELAKSKGVVELDLVYSDELNSIKEFLEVNKDKFEQQLLQEAIHVKEILDEVRAIGKIDLLSNAHRLVNYLIDNKDYEIINFAKGEGQIWAKHSSLNLAVKLEWFQAIRKVLWDFLYNFDRLRNIWNDREDFYNLERQINTTLDIFLRHFFMSYTQYKDELLRAHRAMIDDLSVPLIPLSPSVSVLPLLGAIDPDRAATIQDKVLAQIAEQKIRILLIDMSGVAYLDADVLNKLLKLLDGIRFMGCKVTLTGIRPEIVRTMLELGIRFDEGIQTNGTLQQALEELGFKTE